MDAAFSRIDPCQIGCFQMVHREAFNSIDGLLNQIPISSQVPEKFPMPDLAVTICGERSSETEGIHRRHDACHGLAEVPAKSRIGDDGKGTAEAREC